MSESPGPLEGVRVVALEQAIALPFASCILAEMGADVIKIERPGSGDVVRGWDDAVKGLSSGFVAFNMGKRDVGLDVSKPKGRDALRRLASTADVFMQNFAPGVVERLGLGHDDLMPLNSGLIYCSLSGYGADGPYRDVKAYDLLVQGESGILMNNGYPDAPAKVGMPITDQIAGSHVVMGVLAAILERKSTGKGKLIDVALLDSAFFWLGYYPHRIWHQGKETPRTGMRHQFIAPYGPFLAADGKYVNLVVASDSHWKAFCKAVERLEWLTSERYGSMTSRSANKSELDSEVEALIAERPSDEWFERLRAAGLPYGRVREMSEVVVHPQLSHRQMVVEDDSEVGTIPLVRFPLSRKSRRPVPALGQHTLEVLREAGYSSEELATLQTEKVVFAAPSKGNSLLPSVLTEDS